MGFFDGLGRMIKGEPVFQVGDNSQVNPPQSSSQPNQPNPDVNDAGQPLHNGEKIRPVVRIERARHEPSGDHLEIWGHIQNDSQVPVSLESINILGTNYNLQDVTLNPGQQREIRIYEGSTIKSTSYTKCELLYRDNTGDYFKAQHIIDFKQESDGTFIIYRFRQVLPIYDV